MDINDAYSEEEEEEREKLLADIASELSPQHPICYDTTDLCKCVKEDKLQKFNVTMLKTILLYFDVAFNSKDRKKDLVLKLSSFVQECNCFLNTSVGDDVFTSILFSNLREFQSFRTSLN